MRAIAIAIAIGIATLFAPAIVAWVAGHWLYGFSHHGFGSPRARRLFLKRHLRHLDSARGWGVPTVADEADQEWQEGSPRPRSGARCQGCVAVGGRTSSTAPGRPAGGGSAVWPGPGLVRNLTRWPTLFSFHGIPVKIHVPLLAGLVCSLLALVIPANGLLADILRFRPSS